MSEDKIYSMPIDSFSNATAVDLKQSARNEHNVLYALKYHPRISTFDMSENAWLCTIIRQLENKGFIQSIPEPYPWHLWILTDSGRHELDGIFNNYYGE